MEQTKKKNEGAPAAREWVGYKTTCELGQWGTKAGLFEPRSVSSTALFVFGNAHSSVSSINSFVYWTLGPNVSLHFLTRMHDHQHEFCSSRQYFRTNNSTYFSAFCIPRAGTSTHLPLASLISFDSPIRQKIPHSSKIILVGTSITTIT